MNPIEQQRHEKCDALGRLIRAELIKDSWFGNTTGLRFTWTCQECHDTFETTAPYLEVFKIGGK